MQHFSIHSIDDLISNPSFKKWILNFDEQEGVLWNEWLNANPDKLEWVAVAKAIVLLLANQTHQLHKEEIDEQALSILSKIEIADPGNVESEIVKQQYLKEEKQTSFFKVRNITSKSVFAIFCILLIIAASWLLILQPKNTELTQDGRKAELSKALAVYENKSDNTLLVWLPDSSSVVLDKGSSLSYDTKIGNSNRQVWLKGSGYFNVTKDPSRPFIVYASHLVTKVLGTSFWVKASKKNKGDSVIVHSGKVSVFKKTEFIRKTENGRNKEGLILTPNQQVSYDLENDHLNKQLVSSPIPTSNITSESFVFESAPSVEVFNRLEKIYSIPIIIDEQILSSCSITATLGTENFFEKIAILCKIINAKYEVIDGSVVIDASGCK